MDVYSKSALKEKKKIAITSVFAAIFLTLIKVIVGIMTGSLGILSEAAHSGLDLIAAIMTLFAISISGKPADNDHNYGHGKVENMSALIETLLLVITCFWIIYEAVNRLIDPHPITITYWSFIVIIVSIIVDWSRSSALSRVARKYNSDALKADALHFSTDIYSSLVVLLGLGCSYFGFYFADSIAALIVAIIVLFISFNLGKDSINVLLDKAPRGNKEVIEIVTSQIPDVCKVHDIKIRNSGPETFINLNIHVDHTISVEKAHFIAHEVEERIKSKITNSHVHIHIEPDTDLE